MFRRVLALTLTVVVLGAPLIGVVCQTVCAPGEQAAQQLHACHDAAPTEGPIANGVPHGCGHDEVLPQALERALQSLNAPAPFPVVTLVPPVEVGASSVPALIQHSPPGFFPLISQQRV